MDYHSPHVKVRKLRHEGIWSPGWVLAPLLGSLETRWLVALAQQLSSRGASSQVILAASESLGISGQEWSKKAALLRDTSASSPGVKVLCRGSHLLVEATQKPSALSPKGILPCLL